MTTLPIPAPIPSPDTVAAQDARWVAWQAKAAADAGRSHDRMQIAFVVLAVLASLTFLVRL